MFKKLLITILIGSASFSAMAKLTNLEIAKIYGEKAMTETALCESLVTSGNYDQAFSHCNFAAQKGVPTSQLGLSLIYMKRASASAENHNTNEVRRNGDEMIKWLKKAAKQNKDPEAASLAKQYLSGSE